MLQLRNFTKYYGTHKVLDIPDLTLSAGLYWIKGDNGSGKSSLFKSLAGLIPFSGEVVLEGSISLKKHPIPFRKWVNYGEAEPLYPGFLSAKDLIQFVAKTKQGSVEQQDHLMNVLGVDKFLTQSCGTFSSGMLKKLSLTLAFLGNPKVILLDEPLITLDEAARIQLASLVQDALRKDVLIFISSHQQLELTEYSITQSFMIEEKTLIKI